MNIEKPKPIDIIVRLDINNLTVNRLFEWYKEVKKLDGEIIENNVRGLTLDIMLNYIMDEMGVKNE